jgi:hypothetical protein
MGYPFQTQVVNVDAIKFGSAKVEVGATTSSYIDLGIAQGVTFEEQNTFAWIGADNAEPKRRLVKQMAVVSGSFVEYDPNVWNTLRGGIDVYTSSTGDGGSKLLESGGRGSSQSHVSVQLTNYYETTGGTTKIFRINVWKAYFDGNMTMEFQPDESETPMSVPFSFLGINETTRVTGKKLYRITDEQSTS